MASPTTITEIRTKLRDRFPELADQFGVASLGLFGSYVRRENRPDSDLDILVSFTTVPSLFRYVELENYLSDLLGLKVDLVMRDSLRPHLGKEVLAELVPI